MKQTKVVLFVLNFRQIMILEANRGRGSDCETPKTPIPVSDSIFSCWRMEVGRYFNGYWECFLLWQGGQSNMQFEALLLALPLSL
jgi:hypothetical protein